MPNLFVVVSTGQKVANLPPVLEHARPGDYVLWVESAEAARQKWTDGPRAVLEARGLITAAVVPVPDVNNPVALAAALRPYADEWVGKAGTTFLVANGGTKLTPVGLLFGCEALGPQFLYGDERPAAHSVYPAALDAAPVSGPYARHDLDLPDVLRATGHTFATDSPHRRVWPGALPAEFASEPYGLDEAHTTQRHQLAHDRCTAPPVSGERVAFAQLSAVCPDALDVWRRTVVNARNAQQLNEDRFRDVYSATLKLDERARRAAANGSSSAPPLPPLGPAFERAVARRVCAWLDADPHPAVQSVWTGVKLARESTPHVSDAELDVLLVLRNGILIHLECKSAEVDVPDLDRRTFRLREAGSQLARLAVVLPLYSAHAGAPWFSTQHAARAAVEARKLALIPFTWSGQPTAYAVPGPNSGEQVPCPAFEAELEKLLKPYDARSPRTNSSA